MAVYYSALEKSLSEFIATFVYIFLLETILANHILPKTKGHKLGYGWVAMGIGLSCFLSIQYFGWLSSAVNPVMTLANYIVGRCTFVEFLAISAAETLGAFCAAILVWIYYFPFFKTGTENLPSTDLSVPATLPRPERVEDSAVEKVSLLRLLGEANPTLGDLRKFIRKHGIAAITRDEEVPLIPSSDVFDRSYFNHKSFMSKALPGLSRKWSDRQKESESDIEAPLLALSPKPSLKPMLSASPPMGAQHYVPIANVRRAGKNVSFEDKAAENPSPFFDDYRTISASPIGSFRNSFDFNFFKKRLASDRTLLSVSSMKKIIKPEKDSDYEKKRMADQHAKLAVFAVRPVIYDWPRNLLTEVISTFFLISGILYIRQRGEMNPIEDQSFYSNSLYPFYIGLLIVVLILCLGGPGICMNPARDLGPRLAHWVLPISGKGFSEWYYAWVTIVGPTIGAIGASYFFILTEMMDRSTIKPANIH